MDYLIDRSTALGSMSLTELEGRMRDLQSRIERVRSYELRPLRRANVLSTLGILRIGVSTEIHKRRVLSEGLSWPLPLDVGLRRALAMIT